jgi:subtilase family serine protease
MRLHPRVGMAALAAVATVVPILAVAPGASAAATVRHHGTRPAWATAGRDVGAANGGDRVDLRVWLSLRNAADARALAVAVSDPSSPDYGHYLTPAEFESRYAPTSTQAGAIASWLRSAGLKVATIPANNRYVAATGSVQQAASAFSVTLDNFRVNGKLWRAPTTDPDVPSGLAATIAGITGLDTGDHTNHPASEAPPAGFRNAPPLSSSYGEKPDNVAYQVSYGSVGPLPAFQGATIPYAVTGYTPADYRAAFGLTGDGAGLTIAITDAYAASTMLQDSNTYDSRHGGPSPLTTSTYTETLPASFAHQGVCGASGWPGEETLDVEAAHGIAPKADIHYFGAADCYDASFIDALQAAVSDPAVDVISNSWSGLESQTTPDIATAYEQVFSQAAATGKAVLFSSGDDGDELAATGTKQVDYPSSDPLVIAAGGTSVAIAGGQLLGQTGWGTYRASLGTDSWGTPAWLYGSGGGCSTLFTASYQSGARTGCGSQRGVPDISMDADPNTGMLVGETQTFPRKTVIYDEYRIGGTSLSSPLLAGVLALADQQALATGHANISGPAVLYQLGSGVTDVLAQGSRGSMPDAANVRADYVNSVDATKGVVDSVRTFGQDSSLTLGRGWDQTTGLGTISDRFVTALAAALPAR